MEGNKKKRYIVSKFFGGKISYKQLLFSRDNNYIIAAFGTTLRVFNLNSGLDEFHLSGHTASITKFIYHPFIENYIISGGFDSTIRIWSLPLRKCIHTCELPFPIKDMVFSSYSNNLILLSKEELSQLQFSKLENTSKITSASELLPIIVEGKVEKANSLEISNDGKIVAFTIYNQILLYYFPLKKALYLENLIHLTKLIIVCEHPYEYGSQYKIISGDKLGKIQHWIFNVNEPTMQIQNLVTSTFHWHSHRVNAMVFTQDFSHLLTAGKEGVIVLWHQHTEGKTFISRLGEEIKNLTLSDDDLLLGVIKADNSITVINSITYEQVAEFKQLTISPSYNKSTSRKLFNTELIQDPMTGMIVVDDTMGRIQFYNVEKKSKIFSIDINPTNYTSQTFDEQKLYKAVHFITFSNDGKYMATYESSQHYDQNNYLHSFLNSQNTIKFWKRKEEIDEGFVLNTRMDNPHTHSLVSLKNVKWTQNYFLSFCNGSNPQAIIWQSGNIHLQYQTQQNLNDPNQPQKEAFRGMKLQSYKNKLIYSSGFGIHKGKKCIIFLLESNLLTFYNLTDLKLIFAISIEDSQHLNPQFSFDGMIVSTTGSEIALFGPTKIWSLKIKENIEKNWELSFKAIDYFNKEEKKSEFYVTINSSKGINMDSDKKHFPLYPDSILMMSYSSPAPLQMLKLPKLNLSHISILKSEKDSLLLLYNSLEFQLIQQSIAKKTKMEIDT